MTVAHDVDTAPDLSLDEIADRRAADLESEPRDTDPVIAEEQNERDRYWARGEYEYAERAQTRIEAWRRDPMAGLPELEYEP